MIRYRTLVPSVFLALSLELFAAPVLAAPPVCGSYGEPSQQRAEHMKHHQEKLHASLKLTPEQEGSWQKLVETQGPMIKGVHEKTENQGKLTTPEREELWLGRMKEHQEHMTKHLAALKDFYGELTPEQQKTFDSFHATPRATKHARQARHGRHSSSAGSDAYLASPKP